MRLPAVFRTSDIAGASSNPTRLANRLVAEGRAVKLANGLYARRKEGRFGWVPPHPKDVLKTFLQGREGTDWILTGPEVWNSLGLGSTALFADALVYNHKRTGIFHFGGMPFRLRRVGFPRNPPLEWFVVDLLQHAEEAGVDRHQVTERLAEAIRRGRFQADALLAQARKFGNKTTQALVSKACLDAER